MAVSLLALIGAGVGGYFIFYKDSPDAGEDTAASAQAPNDSEQPTPSQPTNSKPSTPSQPTVVNMDDDPEGPLRLEGQVVDPDGVGVGGARVTLDSNPPKTTSTEDDGSFFFDKLIGRSYQLSARSGNWVGGPIGHTLSTKSAPALIRLRAGGSIIVTVTSQSTGNPIEGAEVSLQSQDERTETTSTSGIARFDGVNRGFIAIKARAKSFGTAQQTTVIPASPGAEIKVTMTLAAGVSVRGVVVNNQGNPVAGAHVSAHRQGLFTFTRNNSKVTTDDKGAFELTGVTLGKTQFTARHRDYAPGQSDVINVTDDITDLKLSLVDGASVKGRVIAKDRQPVAWARVSLRVKGSGGFGRRQLRGTTADDQGIFEMKGLPRQQVTVLGSSETATSEMIELDLEAKPKTDNLEIILGVTGTIGGIVVDSSGEPLAETQVVLYPDWSSGQFDGERAALRGGSNATTDGEGHFVFSGLAEGQYMLKPTNDPNNTLLWQTEGTRARTGDSDVRLVLASPGKVRGTVVSETGKAITNFTVTIGFPPGNPVADSQGKFELDQIPPGKYDVKISGAEFGATTVADVEVRVGETAELGTIRVIRGRTIKGRVVKAGDGIGNATVLTGQRLIGTGESLSLSRDSTMDDMMKIRRATTDDNGYFRIRGTSSKAMVIAAEHPDTGRSRPMQIGKGSEDIELRLELVATGTVKGHVTKGDKPAANVAIVATPSEARMQLVTGQADDTGNYVLDRLAAGQYEVSAFFGAQFQSRAVTRKIVIKGGETQEVDLSLVVGDITLTVSVKPKPGAVVNATQLFLLPGRVSPANGKELNNAYLGREGSGAASKFSMENVDTTFGELAPMAMTLCGLPITGDMSDAQFLLRLQEAGADLEIVCKPLTITETPATQAVEIVVPEMKPLPPPEGSDNNNQRHSNSRQPDQAGARA